MVDVNRVLGLIKLKVVKGFKLAVRDRKTSDPYVVVQMGKDKLRTRVIKKNLNPEWYEDLTLSVMEPIQPIKLAVFDKDTFSFDDPMGDAEIDIKPFMEAVQKTAAGLPDGTVISKLAPNRQNCYAEESCIYYKHGRVKQDAVLRLRHVERGELEVQLQWININSNRGSR